MLILARMPWTTPAAYGGEATVYWLCQWHGDLAGRLTDDEIVQLLATPHVDHPARHRPQQKDVLKVQLYIEEDLWREFCTLCMTHGLSPTKAIENGLRQVLGRGQDAPGAVEATATEASPPAKSTKRRRPRTAAPGA